MFEEEKGMLSRHYFGDLEANDEAQSHYEFFKNTFIVPSSMNVEALSNNRKFIIVGRKGVGKTAVQMRLAQEVEEKGFFVHHFRFAYDLRGDDYAEISRTQSDISYEDASNSKNLFLHYDFRDVWERVFFRRIAEKLVSEGHQNNFTNLVAPLGSKFGSIFSGITKTLNVKFSAPVGPVLVEAGIDLNQLPKKDEISIKMFNQVSRSLFLEHCSQFQFYFFVDELVFSRLDAKEDQITLRSAMVRDILRTAWELNSFCSQNDLAFHFICSLRPEIRNQINDLDSESGKFLDGKDVELSWLAGDGGDGRLILEVLRSKIQFSLPKGVDFDSFIDQKISFDSKTSTLEEFLLSNTWGRPRDVVRLLLSIQKKNPNEARIGSNQVKAALDDYSRASARELIDELGVRHGQNILRALRKGITKKNFASKGELYDALAPHLPDIAQYNLIDELFNLGVIGGYDKSKGYYFWAHRGETYLKDHHTVRIHSALWNEFSIRGA